MPMSPRPLLSLAAAIAAAALPMSAFAAGDAPVKQIEHVEFKDLDLSSDAGQEKLRSRLNRALKEVCDEGITSGTRLASREKASCMARARAQADEQFASIMARRASGG